MIRDHAQPAQEYQGEDHDDSDLESDELTYRQRRFVAEYLIDLNGTRAAIRAGYSEHSADTTAARLLGNDKVAARVREAMARRERRTAVSADAVLTEIAKLAFGDLTEVASWGPDGLILFDSLHLSDAARAQVAEIKETRTQAGTTLTVKRHDKIKALELLARHVGLLTPANDNDNGPPFDLRVLLRAALERAAGTRGARLPDGGSADGRGAKLIDGEAG